MFCAIKIQACGSTQYVKEENLIVFGRKNTYTKFDPKTCADFKPRTEYGVIVNETIKRCLIMGMAATEEEVRKMALKPIKVSSKRPATESLFDYNFNSKKSKQEQQKISGAATDKDIAVQLLKRDQKKSIDVELLNNDTGLVACQIGQELVMELIANEGPVSENDMSTAKETEKIFESDDGGDNNDILPQPKTLSKHSYETSSPSCSKWNINEPRSDTGENPSSEPQLNREETEKIFESDDDDDNNDILPQPKTLSKHSYETSLPSCSKWNINEPRGDTGENPSSEPQLNREEILPPTNCEKKENCKEKEGNDVNLSDFVGNFELTGDEKKDLELIMKAFKILMQVINGIDMRTKNICDEVAAIKQSLIVFGSGQQSCSANRTFLDTLEEEKEILPGYVSFGPNFSVPLKKVKQYTETKDILQTKVNNLTLLVLKDDIVQYCKRLPKNNPKNLKLFPQCIIKKMTEVINDGNREVAFSELIQRERKELKNLKSTEEISRKIEEIRKLSNAQCKDLVEQEISDKLSHTLYNARQLISVQKKKQEEEAVKQGANQGNNQQEEEAVQQGANQGNNQSGQ